jgi:hypothetical protein
MVFDPSLYNSLKRASVLNGYGVRNSPDSLAILAAIRRASDAMQSCIVLKKV